MAEKIRQVNHEDLPALEKLYASKKSVLELQWVLQNPYNPDELEGFVVEDSNGGILGMVGYEVANYKYGNRTISGAIFMSWKISDGYKGFAGVRLVTSVLTKGDFGIAIQGSEMAQSIYSSLGLKSTGISAFTFVKVFRPIKYFLSLRGRSITRRFGNTFIVMPTFFRRKNVSLKSLTIKTINKTEIKRDIPYLHSDYFEKEITKEYLTWLVSCPCHDSYVFEINKGNNFIGYSICYVQKKFHKSPKGRIVYLPNMTNNIDDWKELISFHVSFLKQKKCCSISILSSNNMLASLLLKIGFINYKSKQKPIFIKDLKNNFKEIPFNKWYMQYTESDKAYRSF